MAGTASLSILIALWSGRECGVILKALQMQYPDLLGPCDIQVSTATDYTYRLFPDKTAWTQVLSRLAEETGYDNFKSEVASYQRRAVAA